MNEEEYLIWKGNIVADYRLEGVCIFLALGLILHLQAGGWQALTTPQAALYFLAGFLFTYFLVGEINYQIIITHARFAAPGFGQMSPADKAQLVSRGRRIVRFLQMLVCVLIPWLAYELLYTWKF